LVVTQSLLVSTQGHSDIVDITAGVGAAVSASGLDDGVATVFCPGATGAVTTIEYEDGVVADVQSALETIAPRDADYLHHLRWGDDNGHSHVRAALIGPSVAVPFTGGRLALGTWQQIVFIDCDTRPRSRQLVVQIMGQ
jgi:secondary thiamine-phosphate synthase enzyme